MKESIMEIIVCPVCKGPLELSVSENNSGDIIKGSLFCRKCNQSYPIQDGIPNLLPPQINI
ncbi:MAG: methytransferase partner Trm112 [Dehalococcoidia bacterium]|nr:methytransferase partner Trm112 [Dehalococcoidia bacterium]